MSDVNVMVISGRLTSDPELRFTPKGTAVARLRLASSRYFKASGSGDTDDFQKEDLFITAQAFGKLAEKVASKKKKGDAVLLRGRLFSNEWLAKDGNKRQEYKIHADAIRLIRRAFKNDPARAESVPQNGSRPHGGGDDDIDDDIVI